MPVFCVTVEGRARYQRRYRVRAETAEEAAELCRRKAVGVHCELIEEGPGEVVAVEPEEPCPQTPTTP